MAVAIYVGFFMVLFASEAEAYDRRVRVLNWTNQDIWNIYSTNIDDDQWGGDRLGNQILRANHNIIIDVDDYSGYCMYDIKAVFRDGTEVVSYNFNACEIEEWNIYP